MSKGGGAVGTQTVVQVHIFDLDHPAEAVQVVQAPIPEPGQGEVLVRLRLRPVNPADLFSVEGRWVVCFSRGCW